MKALFAWLRDADASHEDWYSLEFDEEKGEWFIEHEWHYVRFGRPTKQGIRKYTLLEAKERIPEVYEKSIEFLKVRFFGNPPTFTNSSRYLSGIRY